MNKAFTDQARLLIAAMPHVAEEQCFALKGGTAINLFVRNMPRLSVDIDLSYLPVEDRDTSLGAIDQALGRIEDRIKKTLPGVTVDRADLPGTDYCIRLNIVQNKLPVKIEVTPVLRGSVHPSTEMELCPNAEKEFGYARMQLLSFNDLYAGKLCAALDRQHPRDLFDVYYLLKNEGITERIKDTFLMYLISHNRPIAELLAPQHQDISRMYEDEFIGMTNEEVSIDDLYQARDRMIDTIHNMMNDQDKAFLLSVKEGAPKWELSSFPEAAVLPAVRWKLYNIGKMDLGKKKEALKKLEQVLAGKDNV